MAFQNEEKDEDEDCDDKLSSLKPSIQWPVKKRAWKISTGVPWEVQLGVVELVGNQDCLVVRNQEFQFQQKCKDQQQRGSKGSQIGCTTPTRQKCKKQPNVS